MDALISALKSENIPNSTAPTSILAVLLDPPFQFHDFRHQVRHQQPKKPTCNKYHLIFQTKN